MLVASSSPDPVWPEQCGLRGNGMLSAETQMKIAMVGPPALVTASCFALAEWILGIVLTICLVGIAVLWRNV